MTDKSCNYICVLSLQNIIALIYEINYQYIYDVVLDFLYDIQEVDTLCLIVPPQQQQDRGCPTYQRGWVGRSKGD